MIIKINFKKETAPLRAVQEWKNSKALEPGGMRGCSAGYSCQCFRFGTTASI